MARQRAFTLIELLIVVAIIAILAAIAVPNFLEAQTRSKVSRAKSDVRTLVTAIEAYAVDWNKYPADYVLPILVRTTDGEFATAEGYAPAALSTPIAYLTNALLDDPFVTQGGDGVVFTRPQYGTLFYQNVTTSRAAVRGDVSAYNGQEFTGQVRNEKIRIGWSVFPWEQRYGAWKMGSLGPDRIYKGGFDIYDPTNGTISEGDIYRSQKANEGGFTF